MLRCPPHRRPSRRSAAAAHDELARRHVAPGDVGHAIRPQPHARPVVTEDRQRGAGRGAVYRPQCAPLNNRPQPEPDAFRLRTIALTDVGQRAVLDQRLAGQQRGQILGALGPRADIAAAQRLGQTPRREARAPRRLGPGQQRHLAPPLTVGQDQVGQIIREAVIGEIAGRQILLKGAVREGVDPDPASCQQARPGHAHTR